MVGSLLTAYLFGHYKNWGTWMPITLAMIAFIEIIDAARVAFRSQDFFEKSRMTEEMPVTP